MVGSPLLKSPQAIFPLADANQWTWCRRPLLVSKCTTNILKHIQNECRDSKRPTRTTRKERIMNKQWKIGVILSMILSPLGAALGQTHCPVGPDTWSGPVPCTPAQKARSLEAYRLAHAAAAALAAGWYAYAETTAWQAIALGHDSGVAQEVLASALNAQDKGSALTGLPGMTPCPLGYCPGKSRRAQAGRRGLNWGVPILGRPSSCNPLPSSGQAPWV